MYEIADDLRLVELDRSRCVFFGFARPVLDDDDVDGLCERRSFPFVEYTLPVNDTSFLSARVIAIIISIEPAIIKFSIQSHSNSLFPLYFRAFEGPFLSASVRHCRQKVCKQLRTRGSRYKTLQIPHLNLSARSSVKSLLDPFCSSGDLIPLKNEINVFEPQNNCLSSKWFFGSQIGFGSSDGSLLSSRFQ